MWGPRAQFSSRLDGAHQAVAVSSARMAAVNTLGSKMSYNTELLVRRAANIMVMDPYVKLSDLSQALGVERHTLGRAVLAVSGTTFRKLRRRLILERAMRYFHDEPNLSLKEVAARLGFSSARAFTRYVKCATGLTPSALQSSAARRRIHSPVLPATSDMSVVPKPDAERSFSGNRSPACRKAPPSGLRAQ